MKKLVLLMALVCLVMVGVNKPADAALGWTPVTVYAAGSGGGFVWCGIKFTQGAATVAYRMFFAAGPDQNQLLATAMTAMANGGNGEVYFDPTIATDNSFIYYLSADNTKVGPQ
jgi:hypothetical protein